MKRKKINHPMLNQRAVKSLHGYVEMMWREEYSAGYYNLASDLRKLMFVLEDMKTAKK